ncbi:unnamed protein product [Didymodactylos carnosus]|uniref:Reverse transcriptase domain-containing protein n=1 Tax=Didymodactylos carnosus TaxID=1234261 RepID=A0A8S2UPA4_9BILA|nr:unnamed protein product [Didymodactylos carnosus]CAF4354925.1 unnamed protein product [Didymodactylos carnosus]
MLDELLRPLFDKHVRSTTIIDGVDLIRRLEMYTAKEYRKSTTYLCTFDIFDLYTMIPQEESFNILTEFLLEHDYLSTSCASPWTDNENAFVAVHQQLFNKSTTPEYQIASRIAKTTIIESKDNINNLLIQTKLDKETKWLTSLIIHYTHEKRLASYKKDIHQLWNQTFKQTPFINTRRIIDNRSSPNITNQLRRRHQP